MRGRVTIGRYTRTRNGQDAQGVHIEFTDETSRIRFATMEMTLEAFAKTLTGQGEVEADLEVCNLGRVGWVAENKTVALPFERPPYGNKKEEAQIEKAMKAYEVEGWVADRQAINNMHCYKDGVFRINYFRHVKPEEK